MPSAYLSVISECRDPEFWKRQVQVLRKEQLDASVAGDEAESKRLLGLLGDLTLMYEKRFGEPLEGEGPHGD